MRAAVRYASGIFVAGVIVISVLSTAPAPSVVGLAHQRATSLIQEASLEVVTEGNPERNARVCEQEPPPGTHTSDVTVRFGTACESVRQAAERKAARQREAKRKAEESATGTGKDSRARSETSDTAASSDTEESTSGDPPAGVSDSEIE